MTIPEWAARVRGLITQMGQSQEQIALRLGVSPATLSRWVNGRNEPTADRYVALGNLSKEEDRIYFWERAGIERFGAGGESMHGHESNLVSVAAFHVVHQDRVSTLTGDEKLVAIPLLSVVAYADENVPDKLESLAGAAVQEVLTAPADWCPHPNGMIALRVHGDSMFPTIADGSIAVVDTESRDRDALNRKIVVVSHREAGIKVARLQRIGSVYLMVAANHRVLPIDVSNAAKWRVVGEVRWWISRDQGPPSEESSHEPDGVAPAKPA